MNNITLKELAVNHDYYCSDNNYYSNDAAQSYESFPDFMYEMGDADVDMNLVFRWDLKERDEDKGYYMEIFQIKQRKGIFTPIFIQSFEEEDVKPFLEYIKPHMEKLKNIWQPLVF